MTSKLVHYVTKWKLTVHFTLNWRKLETKQILYLRMLLYRQRLDLFAVFIFQIYDFFYYLVRFFYLLDTISFLR